MGSTIEDAVAERFARLAHDPDAAEFAQVARGRAGALALGYAPDDLDALPQGCVARFAGVGNPLALGGLEPGSVLLDLGCGAGVDLLLAIRRLGAAGRAIGIDFTPAMVAAARRFAAQAHADNVEVLEAPAGVLPLQDASVDVVTTNGLLNLCTDKAGVVREMARVLRPAGRLWMADVVLDDGVDPATVQRLGAWSH